MTTRTIEKKATQYVVSLLEMDNVNIRVIVMEMANTLFEMLKLCAVKRLFVFYILLFLELGTNTSIANATPDSSLTGPVLHVSITQTEIDFRRCRSFLITSVNTPHFACSVECVNAVLSAWNSKSKIGFTTFISHLEDQIENVLVRVSEKHIQRQLIFAGCFIIFLLTVSVIFILWRSGKNTRKKNKLLQAQNFEIQAQNEEIRLQHEEILSQSEELRTEGEYLALQNEKLKELNREKDALMSIVAHDLRAPLNQTKGLARILQMSSLSSEQLHLTELVVKVSDDGLRLIKDVLQVNSLTHQPIESEPVILHRLIHESVLPSLQEQLTRKQISVFPSIDKELTLWSDALSLKRILENLLSNAIKFSSHGANVFLRVMSSDDSVYISVQDQGPGISEADQKKMFKRFQRLSARPTSGETSTGLGLAIVKGLVDKLNGEITVNSQINVGTEISIKLRKSNHSLTSHSITANH